MSTTESFESFVPGVAVYGYVFAESGVGQLIRLVIQSLREADIPYSVTPYTRCVTRQEEEFDDFGDPTSPRHISIVGVNADEFPNFVTHHHDDLESTHTIGIWAWEVEDLPDWMARSGELVDEVWACSRFAADSIREAIHRPVYAFPPPVIPPQPAQRSRGDLGLPEEDFLYLFCFDYDSIFERKNPLGLIEAYRRAFPEPAGAHLAIKAINWDRHPEKHQRLLSAASDRDDITILERYVPHDVHYAYVAACDVYVSLHRTEGFGFTLAEAMSLGKPVIGTAYSGNMDFMTEDNSYLVPAGRTPIPEDCDPYPAGKPWGDPHLDIAAEYMRQAFEHPAEALNRGRQARRHILEHHSPEARVRWLRRRLLEIRDTLEPRTDSSPEIRALSSRRQATALLERGPNFHQPTKFGLLGKLARRFVFRCLRHYHEYTTKLHTALLETIPREHSSEFGELTETVERIQKSQKVRQRNVDSRFAQLDEHLAESRQSLGSRLDAIESHLNDLNESLRSFSRAQEGPQRTMKELSERLRMVDSRLDAVKTHFKQLQENIEGIDADKASQTNLDRSFADLAGSLSKIEEELHVAPYMAHPDLLHSVDDNGQTILRYRLAETQWAKEDLYLNFENLFRGNETFIRDRQSKYLDLLRGQGPVLDFGCGRGEMLDLLAEADVPARGVDLDQGMVEHCRAKGHDVEHGDGLDWLRAGTDGSLGGIFASQVVEHLEPDHLQEFLRLARKKLRPTGILIVETVNPHSFPAFKVFWVDPTHVAPVFPETLLAFCRFLGFSEGRIWFPNGTGHWEQDRRTQGEYALAARPSGYLGRD